MRIGGVSVGKVKALELAPPEIGSTARTRPRRDRDRARVRADLRRRAGDPAPEDAARRDLRRAHLRAPSPASRRRRSRSAPRPTSPTPRPSAVESLPEGGTLGVEPGPRRRPRSTRSSTPSTRRPASSFQRWHAERGGRDPGPRPRPQRRVRQPRPVHHRRHRRARDPRAARSEALQGLVRDTGTVFEALTARDQELAGAIVGSNNTFEALASQRRRRWPRRSRSCRPSSARPALTLDRLDEFAGRRPAADPAT